VIGRKASNQLLSVAQSTLHRIRAKRKRWPGAPLRTALHGLLQPAAMGQLIMWQTHSWAALGLLPLGTVNVFAMELGLPLHNLELCWDIIKGTNVRLVDLPSANGKRFVQLAGVGLDAQVVKETSLAFKRSFGPLSYLISAAQIAARQPPRLFIESNNAPVDEGSFVLIGNGRLYGGPFPFFKQAVLDDGLLDVVLFKRLGYLEIIKYLQDVVFSSDIRVPEIEYFQTQRLRITSEQDVPVEIDGELAGNCPVDFKIEQKALRVLAPLPMA
jgi:YegS/Rv2252/BmrU family lipid kinase